MVGAPHPCRRPRVLDQEPAARDAPVDYQGAGGHASTDGGSMMKKILHDFHDIRDASLDPGGRDDIPRPRRARGGKIEMRSAGGSDVDRDQPRRSRRAAGGRSRKTKPMAMSGEAVKHMRRLDAAAPQTEVCG